MVLAFALLALAPILAADLVLVRARIPISVPNVVAFARLALVSFLAAAAAPVLVRALVRVRSETPVRAFRSVRVSERVKQKIEDRGEFYSDLLTSYIQKHGHGNWRALPKQAGLLRCGKSCRLRWINYLRPDIKRGNFTIEEEETIIKLHEMLGNRWSAIAAKLPGRTDNEIKNVWHTNLKKRLLKSDQSKPSSKRATKPKIKRSDSNSSIITQSEPAHLRFREMDTTSTACNTSSSDFSSVTVGDSKNIIKSEDIESMETMPVIDESFWSEAAIDDETPTMSSQSLITISNDMPLQYPFANYEETFQQSHAYDSNFDDGMDFWYDIFTRTNDSIELSEF